MSDDTLHERSSERSLRSASLRTLDAEAYAHVRSIRPRPGVRLGERGMSALAQAAAGTAAAPPTIRVRGRSVMALVVTPELPAADWFAALDVQLAASNLLLERPVVADLSNIVPGAGPEGAAIVLEGLEARGIRLAAVEGLSPAALAGTRWAGQATGLAARPARELVDPPRPAAGPSPSLLLQQPVRSGQTVLFEEGDVTIVGAVASGAEVIAGGSIHVYGPLRGRAIAGLKSGEAARVFCRRLEAEMVGVGRIYRTAENWGAELQGRAVQAWCDRGALRIAALD